MCDPKQKIINWLHEIFEKRGFNNIQISFPDYDTRGGYVANIVYADVTGVKKNRTEEFNTIIKLSKDDPAVTDVLNMRQGYINEVNFYSKILPSVTKFLEEKNVKPFENIPECYGTISKENEYVIILENLKPKGFKMHDIKIHMDYDHIKLGFEAFAKWHALCFAMEDQNPGQLKSFNLKHPAEIVNKFQELWFGTIQNELDFVMKWYGDKSKPHIIERLKSLELRYKDLFRDSITDKGENFLVIKQGDSGNNNFLFRYDTNEDRPNKIIIIDWQMSSLGSPMIDPAIFLFMNGSRKDFEKIDDLLKVYYATLSEEIVKLGSDPEKCFPWKNCLESFEKYAPLAIAIMPLCLKVKFRDNILENFDLAEAAERENFGDFKFEDNSKAEEYLKALGDILEFCVERKYL